MADVTAKFSLNNNNIGAKFNLSEENTVDAIFKIYAAGTTWGSIEGELSNQTDLQAALDLKADKIDLDADVELINQTINENYTALDNKINSVNSDLSEDISTLDNKIDTEISNRTASDTTLQNNINAEALARQNADTVLQGNINTLTQTVTDNNTAINNRVNGIVSSFDDKIETINTNLSDLSDTVSDNYTDLDGKISDLTDTVNDNNTAINNKVDGINTTLTNSINSLSNTVSNNYTALDAKIDNTKNALDSDISDLSDIVSQNYTDLNNVITSTASTINTRIDNEVSTLNTAITTENTQRQTADSNLQSQIDALTSASDVTDIVGTYAELEAYDTINLPVNDIIKVLTDNTHNNASSYYRWNGSTWDYIGSEGPYTTPEYVNNTFVAKTTTVNGKALSNNIVLDASDVNALPNSTVIGSGTLTIQVNGDDVDTFGANSTANKTINLSVPTDTSDLTNNAGFITASALNGYATETWVTNQNYVNSTTLTNTLTNYALSSSLADVATTGDYDDLINKPTIPTVNNGTLTIQKNGTTIGTFTANQSDNSTINIEADTVLTDNTTITKNSSDELQAIGVIDDNTGSALKTWTGTKAQYDAIVTKDPNTLYWLTDTKIIYLGENAVGNFSGGKNVGEIITSSLPLTDAGLHLLDGALIQGDGIYGEFVDYIATMYEENPTANYFTDETTWQNSVTTYGVCGKFVYDSVNNTVRLPKVTGKIDGTTDINALGDLEPLFVRLPNITGRIGSLINWGASSSGSFSDISTETQYWHGGSGTIKTVDFDASRSSSVYSGSDSNMTIHEQAVNMFVYIVIANSTKTDVQANIDNIVTDLNGKADNDLTNVTDTGKILMSGMGMPSVNRISLAFGASGTEYTAPANGWFYVQIAPTTSGTGRLYLKNNTKDYKNTTRSYDDGADIANVLPVCKGDVVQIDYLNMIPWSGNLIRFYYAEGEV